MCSSCSTTMARPKVTQAQDRIGAIEPAKEIAFDDDTKQTHENGRNQEGVGKAGDTLQSRSQDRPQ